MISKNLEIEVVATVCPKFQDRHGVGRDGTPPEEVSADGCDPSSIVSKSQIAQSLLEGLRRGLGGHLVWRFTI